MGTDVRNERVLNNATVWDARLEPLGYEQLTALLAASFLIVPSRARVARIQAQAQALRYRDDGTSPTATVGMVLAAGDSVWYTGDLSKLEIIESAVGGIANVLYYGDGIT